MLCYVLFPELLPLDPLFSQYLDLEKIIPSQGGWHQQGREAKKKILLCQEELCSNISIDRQLPEGD